jgi:cell wall-associated NlpC family hydrolase
MRRLFGAIRAASILTTASGAALAIAPVAGAQGARPAPDVAAASGASDDARGGSAGGEIVVRGPVSGVDVIRAARRHLGVPYRWGGATPRAFDCSGFIQYVFAEYGIELPRTAREQAGVGIAPFPGDLQPGDLLFFYGGRGAQHIALYVGGDSIIHASSTGGRVRFDRLSGTRTKPTWFRRRLIAVRRVLPAEGVFRLPTSTAGGPVTTNLAATGDGRAVPAKQN